LSFLSLDPEILLNIGKNRSLVEQTKEQVKMRI